MTAGVLALVVLWTQDPPKRAVEFSVPKPNDVDDAGNEILRFGGYGNRDSEGPASRIAKPGIPLAYPVALGVSFKHIYVADSANRRVIRVDPTYESEKRIDLR